MKTFTDTDLVVLEDLDFAPPCESKHECDAAASWITEVSLSYCPGRHLQLLCTPHLDLWTSGFNRDIFWRCDEHGNRADRKMTWHEAHTLHRIEAL